MPHIAADIGKIATQLGVNNVYGEPQDIDGTKIIPVSVVWSGFGAGGDENGEGGGGGGVALPVGAYIKSGNTLRFEPNLIALLTVAVPVVWVTGRALRKLIRALKR